MGGIGEGREVGKGREVKGKIKGKRWRGRKGREKRRRGRYEGGKIADL